MANGQHDLKQVGMTYNDLWKTDNPRIPMFRVKLRHPMFGWQVVEVGTLIRCAHRYADWVRDRRDLSVTLEQVDVTVPQCWTVIKSHDGNHEAYTQRPGV